MYFDSLTNILYRIIGKSLFDYKGDESVLEDVFDDCNKLGKICYCKNDDASCGTNASLSACFPTEDPTERREAKSKGSSANNSIFLTICISLSIEL